MACAGTRNERPPRAGLEKGLDGLDGIALQLRPKSVLIVAPPGSARTAEAPSGSQPLARPEFPLPPKGLVAGRRGGGRRPDVAGYPFGRDLAFALPRARFLLAGCSCSSSESAPGDGAPPLCDLSSERRSLCCFMILASASLISAKCFVKSCVARPCPSSSEWSHIFSRPWNDGLFGFAFTAHCTWMARRAKYSAPAKAGTSTWSYVWKRARAWKMVLCKSRMFDDW